MPNLRLLVLAQALLGALYHTKPALSTPREKIDTKRNDPWSKLLYATTKGHFCSLLVSNIFCNPLFPDLPFVISPHLISHIHRFQNFFNKNTVRLPWALVRKANIDCLWKGAGSEFHKFVFLTFMIMRYAAAFLPNYLIWFLPMLPNSDRSGDSLSKRGSYFSIGPYLLAPIV